MGAEQSAPKGFTQLGLSSQSGKSVHRLGVEQSECQKVFHRMGVEQSEQRFRTTGVEQSERQKVSQDGG